MKIGLIDNDFVSRDHHNFPNLAIMKMSSFYKDRGDDVELITFEDINPLALFNGGYDQVYISKAFTDSSTPDFIHKLSNVKLGGTGFYYDKATPLPYEIEHSQPDYHIYDKHLKIIKNLFFTPIIQLVIQVVDALDNVVSA